MEARGLVCPHASIVSLSSRLLLLDKLLNLFLFGWLTIHLSIFGNLQGNDLFFLTVNFVYLNARLFLLRDKRSVVSEKAG